jgi:hypothetical protein
VSRNLLRTSCARCQGVVRITGKTKTFEELRPRSVYVDEYRGTKFADATCAWCGALYLAWCSTPPGWPSMSCRLNEEGFFDLSFRSSFNDEPGPGDLPAAMIHFEHGARDACAKRTLATPLRDQAILIVAVADKIREARGSGPWSSDNLPGKDQERARLVLTIVDGWLTGQAGATPLRELLDEIQTLLRTARGALTGLTGFTAITGSAVAEARADIEQAIARLDDWNRSATKRTE